MHAKSSQLSSLAGRLAAYKKVDTGCMHAATASSQPARIPVFRTRLVRRSDVDGWADGAASNSASGRRAQSQQACIGRPRAADLRTKMGQALLRALRPPIAVPAPQAGRRPWPRVCTHTVHQLKEPLDHTELTTLAR
jgi:hypothetical protein